MISILPILSKFYKKCIFDPIIATLNEICSMHKCRFCQGHRTQPFLLLRINKCRSIRSQMFFKIDVLKYFAKFTGKYLHQSLFFNKVSGAVDNFVKKEALAQVFSCKFSCKSLRTFFNRTLLDACF